MWFTESEGVQSSVKGVQSQRRAVQRTPPRARGSQLARFLAFASKSTCCHAAMARAPLFFKGQRTALFFPQPPPSIPQNNLLHSTYHHVPSSLCASGQVCPARGHCAASRGDGVPRAGGKANWRAYTAHRAVGDGAFAVTRALDCSDLDATLP